MQSGSFQDSSGVDSTPDLTRILARWSEGDEEALATLVTATYDELHRRAVRAFRREGPAHTLQPTVLVHEVFLKLKDQLRPPLRREHFFAFAALTMKRLLVHHAEKQRARKKSLHVTLWDPDVQMESEVSNVDVLALRDALASLDRIDPEARRIVEIRFFGGLTMDETASVMGLSLRTVNRRWTFARAWLFDRMNQGCGDT